MGDGDGAEKEGLPAGAEAVIGEFELARERLDAFDPDAWRKALEQKREMDPLVPGTSEPDPRALAKVDRKKAGRFIPDGDVKATVHTVANPNPRASFGFVGAFAEVKSRAAFAPGTLVLRVDPDKLGTVTRESLRLFWWEPEGKTFHLVEASGVGKDGDYVWGQITAPGIYAAIGLSSDPAVLRTITSLKAMSDVLRTAKPAARERIQRDICQLILCADMAGAFESPRELELLLGEGLDDPAGDPRLGGLLPGRGGRKPPPGGRRPPPRPRPGNICDQCLGLHIPDGLIPDFELIPGREYIPGGGITIVPCVDSGWADVGPKDVAGCIYQVAVDPTDSNRIFCAAANGGVWRLDSVAAYPGSTWTPLTDTADSLGALCIAISALDGRIVYMADALGRVLRSNDRGATWAPTSSTHHAWVRRLLVHPGDPDTVFAATSSGFRGSTDGGATWTVLRGGDYLDAAMDPVDSSILYAGELHQGVFKSYNLGQTWKPSLAWSAATTPSGSMIRIAVGRQGTEATRTVAVKFAEEVFVNRKGGRPPGTPGGGPWQSKGKHGGDGYGFHCHAIAVDPFDDNVILAGAQELRRTSNGGTSWTTVASSTRRTRTSRASPSTRSTATSCTSPTTAASSARPTAARRGRRGRHARPTSSTARISTSTW
ncbi:MAG: hypothetical protein M3340_12590 [Actinomycetota bacterium]|nr:hypothetical protein [Actinomycetota bacterium]